MTQLNEKEIKEDLVFTQIKNSKRSIRKAQILLKIKKYRKASNCAYNGIYQAISAIHALEGNPWEWYSIKESDVFHITTREEAEERIQTAKELIKRVEAKLKGEKQLNPIGEQTYPYIHSEAETEKSMPVMGCVYASPEIMPFEFGPNYGEESSNMKKGWSRCSFSEDNVREDNSSENS